MLDLLSLVRTLKRPGMLVRAARFGVDAYTRDRQLCRLLKVVTPPRPGEALMRLMEIEDTLDQQRRQRAAEYEVARHITVLTAIMGEARLLEATGGRAADRVAFS